MHNPSSCFHVNPFPLRVAIMQLRSLSVLTVSSTRRGSGRLLQLDGRGSVNEHYVYHVQYKFVQLSDRRPC